MISCPHCGLGHPLEDAATHAANCKNKCHLCDHVSASQSERILHLAQKHGVVKIEIAEGTQVYSEKDPTDKITATCSTKEFIELMLSSLKQDVASLQSTITMLEQLRDACDG